MGENVVESLKKIPSIFAITHYSHYALAVIAIEEQIPLKQGLKQIEEIK